jgi:hypothetical protein
MEIGTYWLNDDELSRLSLRSPSTPWGKELMLYAWPRRFPILLSSDTYRGYATVLNALYNRVKPPVTLVKIERLIEEIDSSIQSSKLFPYPSDILGGALIAVTNAWDTSHTGIAPERMPESFESELIYTASIFMQAKNKGM